jgi:hypothetical protein
MWIASACIERGSTGSRSENTPQEVPKTLWEVPMVQHEKVGISILSKTGVLELRIRKANKNGHGQLILLYSNGKQKLSVADLGCLSRIRFFSILDPGSASKNVSILTQKKMVSKLSEI